MRLPPLVPAILLLLVVLPVAANPLVLEGELPDDGTRFVLLPFTVPEGIAELEVAHDDLSAANILDWGLEDPDGFRGWGGGNEEPAVVNALAASRSYLPGPIRPGEWKVIVGKAKVDETPVRYRVEISLRAEATLAPQTVRRPYAPAAALSQEARWYAGDLHVHSRESGDARPPLDEIGTFARSRGLDFVALSDHNTVAQLDYIGDAQSRHPALLFVPSVEFTTYAGHANAFGATRFVDFRVGFNGQTIDAAMDAFGEQGALFTINHPALELGDSCIGCAWKHRLEHGKVAAVEIGTGGLEQAAFLFVDEAIAFWDRLSAKGAHVAAVGGSDDHRAGVNLGVAGSPIGDPTTMVFASELSVAGLTEGIRSGRTVVKLQGPADPMVELDAEGERRLDTVAAPETRITARVTGGKGHTVRLVRNGQALDEVAITSDPFVLEHRATAPEQGEDRFRAEVLVGGTRRTVTSHFWLVRAFAAEPDAKTRETGCGCASGTGGLALAPLLLLAALVRRRRPVRVGRTRTRTDVTIGR